MNKLTIKENFEFIRIPEHNIPNQKGSLHIQSTSGSTGTPFKIPQDTGKRKMRVAELKYFGSVVGFKSHTSLIHLRTWNRWQQKSPRQIKSQNILPFDIANMGEVRLRELMDAIYNYRPVCLRGYASSFDFLARYMEANNISNPSVKVIIAGSEALQDDVRDRVKKVLGCEILSQYANEENGILGQEKVPTKSSGNPIFLNHANYIFEFLKLDHDEPASEGEVARIVLTDMTNHAFPLIRYDTGDTAIYAKSNPASNGWPFVVALYGRRFDLCTTPDGSFFFPMTIGRIIKHYDFIKQWQFIQRDKCEYVMKIVSDLVDDVSIEEITKECTTVLGNDAKITVEYVDEIPVLSSGKRKPVVNEWNEKRHLYTGDRE